MTRQTLSGLIAAAALATASVGAFAAEATYEPADANKDGWVTQQERMNYHAQIGMPSMIAASPVVQVAITDEALEMRLPNGMIDPGQVGGA